MKEKKRDEEKKKIERKQEREVKELKRRVEKEGQLRKLILDGFGIVVGGVEERKEARIT